MTAQRSTKEEKLYRKYKIVHKSTACPFCEIKIGHPQFVEETDNFMVISNRIPYSIWDGQIVKEHLMLVPKVHTDRLGGIDSKHASEYLQIINKYESEGYNMYSRAPQSKIKSVFHQHTHLLKLGGNERKFLFFMRKPFYVRASY